MNEKDKDISGNKEDIIDANIINTNSNRLELKTENNIESSSGNILSNESKIFKCEIFNKGRIDSINFIIDEKKKYIEIKLLITNQNKEKLGDSLENGENYINLKIINQIDFVSFMSQEEINEVKMNEIKSSFLLNLEKKNEKNSTLLNEKEICALTYFPYITKSECNFCKCIFCCQCKCTKSYKIRELITDYFLIKSDYINTIKECLYHISLPKLHELQSNDRKRKILAFINPIGGKGKALELWERAKKVFTQTKLEIDTIITRQYKEAYNYVLTLDPMKYDGFIACSGDGIIHEIINAIFHRNEIDKNKFLERCAICALPAGSGNALSKAISDYSGDDNRIETHCYYLCKGIKKKIDVQEFQLKGLEKKVYSVVAFMYGFIADCDLESEFLRCIGFFRTTIWGVIRYICLRNYLGTLYYLPNNSSDDTIKQIPDINENIDDISKYGLIKSRDQFNIFLTNNIKYSSENLCSHPLAELDDGHNDVFTIGESKGGGRWPLLRYLLNDMEKGTFFTDEEKNNLKNGYQYYKVKWWRFIPKKSLDDPDDVNQNHIWNQKYSIDGERYPICPVQCCTINKIFNIYSGKE